MPLPAPSIRHEEEKRSETILTTGPSHKTTQGPHFKRHNTTHQDRVVTAPRKLFYHSLTRPKPLDSCRSLPLGCRTFVAAKTIFIMASMVISLFMSRLRRWSVLVRLLTATVTSGMVLRMNGIQFSHIFRRKQFCPSTDQVGHFCKAFSRGTRCLLTEPSFSFFFLSALFSFLQQMVFSSIQ